MVSQGTAHVQLQQCVPCAGAPQVELERLVAEEEARAALLEQRAAREEAEWGAESAEYAAVTARLAELREDVAAAEEACSAAARQQGAKYTEQLQRCVFAILVMPRTMARLAPGIRPPAFTSTQGCKERVEF